MTTEPTCVQSSTSHTQHNFRFLSLEWFLGPAHFGGYDKATQQESFLPGTFCTQSSVGGGEVLSHFQGM
jgi:hypothetical protein